MMLLFEMLERRMLLAGVPDGFTDTQIANELPSPTAMTLAPDGRIFVAGQRGHFSVIQNGQASTIFTIPNVNFEAERGFGGIVVDPDFSSNGWLYVYYTRDVPGIMHNRVARYTINTSNELVGSETVILDLPDIAGAIFHMGGALHFGPDGKLYVAVGDHLDGSAAQRTDNVFGKILRINSDGSIPADNPFYTQTTGMNRAIWAIGFRNPFTFAFQSGSGRMFINDVGQEKWEEIDDGKPGLNYGWPWAEGPDNPSNQPGLTFPFYSYRQDVNGECAITGAAFYNPVSQNFPSEYLGRYFFADLCAGWIHTINPSDSGDVREFATALVNPVDLDVSSDGTLYYLERGNDVNTGRLGRIGFGNAGAPSLSNQPESQTVIAGSSVSFSVEASGAGTLRYQWQRNSRNIAGANSPVYTIPSVQTSHAGNYRVIVENDAGSITSNAATLTVIQGGAPQVSIDTPAAGTSFRAGQTFAFSGSAFDPEDGQLAADRFTWQVDYYTGSVVRPFVAPTSGITSGSFTIPTETPYKAADVFYRIRLTVTDSTGISSTVTRDLQPITAKIILRSNISGAQVLLDEQPKSAPTSTIGVAGVRRLLGAPQTLNIDGIDYVFSGWSDGGEREHEISTPTSDITYIARYREAPNTSVKGLGATIYNNRDRSGTIVTTNVNTIDFDWGQGSPDPLIHPDTFFIRFRGKVQPEFTETYTFYARADDGVRLFVNGQLLINQWNDSDGSELSGSIALEAGRKYDLRFDYFENTADAQAQLLWSSPSTPKQIIPRSKLFATRLPRTLVPTADAFVQGGSESGSNFGTRDRLITKIASGERFDREAYLKFDISNLSLDEIGSARLRFFGRLSGDQDINIATAMHHAPAAKWGERTITWETRPAAASKAITTAVVTNNRNQVWEFDVTTFLRGEKQAGRTIVTFVLKNLSDSQVYTLLYSREATTVGPQLVVAV